MQKAFLFILLLLVVIIPSFGQIKIRGNVLDQVNRKPISFVNIGILNSNVGTISNDDGSFVIRIPKSYLKDTLIFSAIGYGRRSIPVSSISGNERITISLRERVINLKPVMVSAKREKKIDFRLGNRHHYGRILYADSVAAGSAIALLIENKHPNYYPNLTYPVFVEKALLKIHKNTVGEFKVRVRLLEVDSTNHNLPGKDILNESVVVKSRIKKGWLTFDLSSYNLKIAQPRFYLMFEWIMEDKDRLALMDQYVQFKKQNPDKVSVDTSMVNGEKILVNSYRGFTAGTLFAASYAQFNLDRFTCYYRLNSFGEWRIAPAILTARIQVSNQPGLKPVESGKNRSDKELNCQQPTPNCKAIKLAEQFLNEHSVEGMQLTVSVKGAIVLSKGFGYSDITNSKPVTTSTQFRVGSVSKALSAAALIKLEGDNKLDLDVPVQQYIPSYPQKRYKITTRQLAGHLSGIRHYKENNIDDLIRKEHYKNVLDAISIFENDTLLFKPGTKFLYSSYGWNLVGAVIERASNQNFIRYMHEHIWQPLSMLHTYADVADSIMPYKSKFYLATGEESVTYDLSYKYPSGGLLSTTEDLVRFGNELLLGNYLDRTLKKQLFETQSTIDGKATKYGLGWNIGKDRNGHTIWFHIGNLLEGSAYLILYPDDDIVVAFLANSQKGLSLDIQGIGELFYGK